MWLPHSKRFVSPLKEPLTRENWACRGTTEEITGQKLSYFLLQFSSLMLRASFYYLTGCPNMVINIRPLYNTDILRKLDVISCVGEKKTISSFSVIKLCSNTFDTETTQQGTIE